MEDDKMINIKDIKVAVYGTFYGIMPMNSPLFPSVNGSANWLTASVGYDKVADCRYLQLKDESQVRQYITICEQYNLPIMFARYEVKGIMSEMTLFTKEQLVFGDIDNADKFKAFIIGTTPSVLAPYLKNQSYNTLYIPLEKRGIEVWGCKQAERNTYDHYAPGIEAENEAYVRPQFEMPQVQDRANPGDLTVNRPCFDIISIDLSKFAKFSCQLDMMDYALQALRPGGLFIMSANKQDILACTTTLVCWLDHIAPVANGRDMLVGIKRSDRNRAFHNIEDTFLRGWLSDLNKVDLEDGNAKIQPLSMWSPPSYPPAARLEKLEIKTSDYSKLVEWPTYTLDRKRADYTEKGITREEIDQHVKVKKIHGGPWGWEIRPMSEKEMASLLEAVESNEGWILEKNQVLVSITADNGTPISELEALGFGKPRIAWGGVELKVDPEKIDALVTAIKEKGWKAEVKGATIHTETNYHLREIDPLTIGNGQPLLVSGVYNLDFMERFCTEPPFPEDVEMELEKLRVPLMPSPAHVIKMIDMLDDQVVEGVDGLLKLISGGVVPTSETVQTVSDKGHPIQEVHERFPAKLFIYDLEGPNAGNLTASTVG